MTCSRSSLESAVQPCLEGRLLAFAVTAELKGELLGLLLKQEELVKGQSSSDLAGARE